MIEVSALVKRYSETEVESNAVDGISFGVQAGELVTLLGPSGCGKTTTLRMLAGLERPTAGEIHIGGAPMYLRDEAVYVPANRRPVGMVFQSYAIWPHMTVFENVAYSLRVSKPQPDKHAIRERTHAALEAVGLGGYAQRPGTALSGGQQQRAALARALVKEPQVLLLDEPLSNLDATLRDRMRHWMREVQTGSGLTTVYVTHDQDEALAISDRVLLMDAGRIVESGTPQDVYRHPQRAFTAGFVGVSNRLEGVIDSPDSIETAQGKLTSAPTGLPVGERVTVFIRPEDLSLGRESRDSAWRGVLKLRLFQGAIWDLYVQLAACELRVRVVDLPGELVEGDEVYVEPDPAKVIVIDERDSAVRADQHEQEAQHA